MWKVRGLYAGEGASSSLFPEVVSQGLTAIAENRPLPGVGTGRGAAPILHPVDILPRERRIEALLDQRFEWTARQREVLDLIARGKTNQ